MKNLARCVEREGRRTSSCAMTPRCAVNMDPAETGQSQGQVHDVLRHYETRNCNLQTTA
jgi:hypothetical protein